MKIKGAIVYSGERIIRWWMPKDERNARDAASGFAHVTRPWKSVSRSPSFLLLPYFFFFCRSPPILAGPMHDDAPSRKISPSRMRERTGCCRIGKQISFRGLSGGFKYLARRWSSGPTSCSIVIHLCIAIRKQRSDSIERTSAHWCAKIASTASRRNLSECEKILFSCLNR